MELTKDCVYVITPSTWKETFHFKFDRADKDGIENHYFYWKEVPGDKGFSANTTSYPKYKIDEWHKEGCINPYMIVPESLFELND